MMKVSLRMSLMINFVEIALCDPSYLSQHDDLDAMLADGWQIIGHAVYYNEGESTERYTLHKPSVPFDTPESVAEKMQTVDSIVANAKRLGMVG